MDQEWKHGALEEFHCLSLWEPWASFVAHGLKTWETRSWTTPRRTSIGIHASKNPDYLGEIGKLCQQAGMAEAEVADFRARFAGAGWPLGCVIAVVRIEQVLPTGAVRHTLSRREKAFGDYQDRRFAWRLVDRYVLPRPVPARGMQCLWQPTPEVRQKILDQVRKPSCIT